MISRSFVKVIFANTDAMGMVYHAEYLKWFELGRTELLEKMGFSYKKIVDEGIYLPVRESFCRYRKPAKYNDRLVIETKLGLLKKATVKFEYLITREKDGDKIVEGYTEHASTLHSGKVVPLPENIRVSMCNFIKEVENG